MELTHPMKWMLHSEVPVHLEQTLKLTKFIMSMFRSNLDDTNKVPSAIKENEMSEFSQTYGESAEHKSKMSGSLSLCGHYIVNFSVNFATNRENYESFKMKLVEGKYVSIVQLEQNYCQLKSIVRRLEDSIAMCEHFNGVSALSFVNSIHSELQQVLNRFDVPEKININSFTRFYKELFDNLQNSDIYVYFYIHNGFLKILLVELDNYEGEDPSLLTVMESFPVDEIQLQINSLVMKDKTIYKVKNIFKTETRIGWVADAVLTLEIVLKITQRVIDNLNCLVL